MSACGLRRTLYVLYHFDITRKGEVQCFDGIWDIVREYEKKEGVYEGALWNTTAHWNGSLELSPEVVSRDPYSRVHFNASLGRGKIPPQCGMATFTQWCVAIDGHNTESIL